MANTNKIQFGLRNVHYAVITETEGAITYGTPKKLPGAVNLSLTTRGDLSEFYADDMAYFVATANNGYEGDLEVALITDEFRVDVLGDELDKNDVLFENANAIPKRIALMYEFQGDVNATKHVNYNVSVSRPDIEGATKEESIEPTTETLAITASPNADGYVKARALVGSSAYATFYDTVYEYTEIGV